jgi:hypothetical protein
MGQVSKSIRFDSKSIIIGFPDIITSTTFISGGSSNCTKRTGKFGIPIPLPIAKQPDIATEVKVISDNFIFLKFGSLNFKEYVNSKSGESAETKTLVKRVANKKVIIRKFVI